MVALAYARPAAATPDLLTFQALGDSKAREKLSGPAIRLFLGLADAWRLNVDERCRLLGDISKPSYHNWRKGKIGTLGRDQIERISLLLGIYKGVKLLFADEAASMRWLKSPNTDIPFGGKSPLERALCGSIDDLYALRRYIDAWRGGT
jgi:Protein of unknown function (DUF2384)